MSVTVLMYHEVLSEAAIAQLGRSINPSYVVTDTVFRQHLQAISDAGATVVTPDDVHDWLEESRPLPDRAVLITFDDGFAGNHDVALPILQEFGFAATFFVATNKIGDDLMMDWEQVRTLHESGMTVASHTVSHPLLSVLDEAETELELARSQQIIGEHVGEPARHLSLPNGDTNAWYRGIAEQLGYRTVFGSRFGRNAGAADRMYLDRIAIKRTTSSSDVTAYVEGSLRVFAAAFVKEAAKKTLVLLLTKKRYDALYNRFFGVDEQRKGHAH